MRIIIRYLIFAVIIGSIVSGCADQETDNASLAVERYLGALVARDLNSMIAASCSDWEADARVEFDSFNAVSLQLENLQCRQTRGQDEFALVTCTGSLIANYGAEQLEIDVANRTFRVINQGGEWRMCGYSQE